MSDSDEFDIAIEDSGDERKAPVKTPSKNNNNDKPKKKKLSVERVYQKKTQLEHILLRPDTYIGSVEPVTQQMWVYSNSGENEEDGGMELRDITYVPGLYKIFDEILVNAADNKQRDKKMDCLRIDIDPESNKICIYNNGQGIPVVEHKTEKMFVPSLIFGHLLTSSNYNDDEKKVTGGRNGYGAKLCNIFSNKFIVETSSKEYKKSFKQTWEKNMSKCSEAKIVTSSGEDFTRITFYPDLSKFKMDKLDRDIVDLMTRRAYDIAGTTKGVKVILNGKRLPIKGFKDYVDLYLKGKEDEAGNPLKCAYENVSDRWEIAVSVSEKGLQQVSFVNSIATTKGGRHVDYIVDQVVNKLVEVVKKKNKAGVNVKPFQIKNHLWVFVNCLIENPTFDSQTKENMTLQMKSFGSKCTPAEKFFNAAIKTGIVEAIMMWVKFKAETQLATKCHSKKHSKLRGIPKLEDANDAGTKNSIECTLILTEGDSAKSLAVAGLGVVGRDKYGVFPLKGKMLNVREATHKQILENAEINNVIKIMGLQYKKKYETIDDLKTLRYGKLMIMTDQDQDGSHIKGLLINFIHHNWPSLLRLPFLEEFITPIVKVTKGSEVHSFYSLPEFEEWKTATTNWSTWKVKYYKGLGTSTTAEAKEYFSDLRRHRITFKYVGPEDDSSINLAFSKKMVDQRKDWLTTAMENRKRRRELGLSEVYLYEKDTKNVTYKDFINKELILFSNMDNERSIPSMMDGLKPGQRKVMFTCFLRNDKKEVKVAQLAGAVGEKSAYHHGEASLNSTIINLAQNYVGSNNINLLLPIGQFGTRLQGGKDAASPRYIFTMLSTLARKIFSPHDEPLLNHLYDDNQKIEPEYYVPILPMVLVNGAEGIGTGWSTKLPNYNPREIVANLKRLINGDETVKMMPWYKGYRGEIEQVDTQRFVVSGEVATLDAKSFEITELPIRVWTQTYKESNLEFMLHGNEKIPSFISDYREYHTESTVRFVVTLSEANLTKALDQGMHKTFKLQTSFTTTSMVLFDHNGCMKRYDSPDEILKEFFTVRLKFYEKRKQYKEGMLSAEALKLSNQARFILEKIDDKIKLENVKRADFVKKLIDRGYDSDPVAAWRKKSGIVEEEEEEANSDNEDEREKDKAKDDKYDFDYLFDMTMRSMLREKVDELTKKRDAKKAELEKLRNTSIEEMWLQDLDDFLEELDRVEKREKEIIESGAVIKASGKPMKGAARGKGNKVSEDSKPSPFGERIPPQIDAEYYKKGVADAAKKTGKRKRDEDEGSSKPESREESDDDLGKPLSERIGTSPRLIEEKKAKVSKIKKLKPLNGKDEKEEKKPQKKNVRADDDEDEPKKKKGKSSANNKDKGKKKKNPWSDSEESDDDVEDNSFLSSSESEREYVPKSSSTRTREPKSNVEKRDEAVNKNGNNSENEKDNDETEIFEKDDLFDDTAYETTNKKEEKKKEWAGSRIRDDDVVDVDSDDDLFISKAKPAEKKRTSEELFDAYIKPKSPPKSSKISEEEDDKEDNNGDRYVKDLSDTSDNDYLNGFKNDDDDDEEFVVKEKEKKKVKAKETSKKEASKPSKQKKPQAKKKSAFSDSDDDFSASDSGSDFSPKKKKSSKPSKTSKPVKTTKPAKTAPKAAKGKGKQKKEAEKEKSSDRFELDEETLEVRSKFASRVKQPFKYNFGDDSDTD